jgi:hypothetical protein
MGKLSNVLGSGSGKKTDWQLSANRLLDRPFEA